MNLTEKQQFLNAVLRVRENLKVDIDELRTDHWNFLKKLSSIEIGPDFEGKNIIIEEIENHIRDLERQIDSLKSEMDALSRSTESLKI